MSIEFAHTRDRRYARRLVAATHRGSRIVMVGTGLLLTLSGMAAYAGRSDWGTLCGTAAVVFGICWLILSFFLPWQLVRRLSPVTFQRWEYRIDAAGVEWTSPVFRSRFDWAMVGRFTTEPFAYLLWPPGGLAAWDLPRGSLTPEQDRDLAALLAERVSTRPAPEVAPTEAAPGAPTAGGTELAGTEPADGVPPIRRPTP